MKEAATGCLLIVALIIVVLSMGWFFRGAELLENGFFAPKEEAVRRNVFENTKSYNQGMIQQLQNNYIEYVKGDDATKAAIASVLSNNFADYNDMNLPPNLRSFMSAIRNGQTFTPEKGF